MIKRIMIVTVIFSMIIILKKLIEEYIISMPIQDWISRCSSSMEEED